MRNSSPTSANHLVRAAGVAVLLASLTVITGLWLPQSTPAEEGAIAAAVPDGIDMSLVDKTWVVQLAPPGGLEAFESNMGWTQLVARGDIRGAVKQLSVEGGPGAARAHADAASMYKQAALLSAQSVVETYGETPKDSDPDGVAHLLTVSYAILGQPDQAITWSAKLGTGDQSTADWHDPWRQWLANGASWPPELDALPVELPDRSATAWPVPPMHPDYVLTDAVSSGIEVNDPSWLVALALWHDWQARRYASDRVIDLYSARYRLPAEGPVLAEGDLPQSFLFGGELLMSEDARFVVALLGPLGGGSVDVYSQTSLLAGMARASRTDGVVDAEKATDLAAQLRSVMLRTQRDRAGGTLSGSHRMFADLAELSVLRTLALVAEVEGQHETSGILRIGAQDRGSALHAAHPAFILSFATWDADNRYTIRPLERLDHLISRYPELAGSRWALEALALRVVGDKS